MIDASMEEKHVSRDEAESRVSNEKNIQSEDRGNTETVTLAGPGHPTQYAHPMQPIFPPPVFPYQQTFNQPFDPSVNYLT